MANIMIPALIMVILGIVMISACALSSDKTAAANVNNEIIDVNFQKALETVIIHEGGYSDDKRDPGGATKFGISLRFLKGINGDIDGDGDVDRDDIIKLTRTHADEIYLHHWWHKHRYNLIHNPEIATKIMDGSINMGAGSCHRLVERAINTLIDDDIKVDTILDNSTIKLLNTLPPHKLLQALRDQYRWHYMAIIERNPKLIVYKNGWFKRAAS